MSLREYIISHAVNTHTYDIITEQAVEALGQNFFLVHEDNLSLLDSSAVLLEIKRRTEVFREGLDNSGNIYTVFSDAYKGTIQKINQNKGGYISQVAQGLLSVILFGHNTYINLERDDTHYIRSRLQKLFPLSGDDTKDKIKKDIIDNILVLVDQGYKLHTIDTLGMRQELHYTPRDIIATIMRLHGRMDKELIVGDNMSDIDSLLFDLLAVKNKYSHIIYDIYTQEPESFYGSPEDALDFDMFMSLVSTIIELLPMARKIKSDEMDLYTTITNTITNDNSNTAISSVLLEKISQHVDNHTIICSDYIRYRDEDRQETITVNTENFGTHQTLYHKNIYYILPGGIRYDSPLIENIMREFKRYKTLKTFDTIVGTAHHEQIDIDKNTIGAKGAYLKEIDRILPQLHTFIHDTDISLYARPVVPVHEDIPAEQYLYWKKHKTLNISYFKEIFGRRSHKKMQHIIIRSSAVFSEDNDQTTGAGIYHSEPLLGKYTFKDFCTAIEKVYISCDSENALLYRQKNNIGDEKMGISIQKYIHSTLCQVNSIMVGRPELMELQFAISEDRSCRVIINKERLEHYMFQESGYEAQKKVFHLSLDWERYGGRDLQNHALYIAQYTYLLERYFQKSIQGEMMAYEEYDQEKGYHHTVLYHLQTRPLPVSFHRISEHEIIFPTEEAIHKSFAIGRCDETLDVLPNNDFNADKKGVVIFKSSHGTSLTRNIENRLPKEGAVIILANAFDGHIETLCLEKGLVCLFPEPSASSSGLNIDFFNRAFLGIDTRQVNDSCNDFQGHKKVRIIANGLEGRIYPTQ